MHHTGAEQSQKGRPACRTVSIGGRRYPGCKHSMLGFIRSVADSECKGIETVADIFAGTGQLLADTDAVISSYGLSDTRTYGYEKYGGTGSAGLAEYNRERYNRLRSDYNALSKKGEGGYEETLMLFVLIVFSFNNQMRFNSRGEFNMPAGKRDFNSQMRSQLTAFAERLKEGEYIFTAQDFRTHPADSWNEDTFVYADPPYLISRATYNGNGGWTE